ncbi:MAG: hypothetical protein LBS72_04220 [Oscillospiraceae bacterium]|jgi:hypothetical protein|nr:hypothetical protein [Oscillospiraceae bacterium]
MQETALTERKTHAIYALCDGGYDIMINGGDWRMCVLWDRVCIECGECNNCDLDPEKICDNCMKCVGSTKCEGAIYRAIRIDGVLTEDERLDDEEI